MSVAHFSKTQAFMKVLLESERRRGFLENTLMLAAWAAIVLYQVSTHVMWRDEARALSIALAGDGISGLWHVLHGEGHPAVWYLLLRGAYAVFGNTAVLPGMAFAIALLAVFLLIFFSPLPRALVIAILASHWFLFEYSVMARNYGISALLLFVLAASYKTWRDRGPLLGLILLLLANTNVIGTLMAGAFLLFWFLELWQENGLRWTAQWRNFALNAALAAVGAVICGLTILPTFNDAAARDWSSASPVRAAILAILNPGSGTAGTLINIHSMPGAVRTLMLLGAILLLLPRRAAFWAALAGLLLLSLFTGVAAQGAFRHALVWFSFYVALLWISWKEVCDGLYGLLGKYRFILGQAGFLALLAILGLQLHLGLTSAAAAVANKTVASRSAELSRLLQSRPELAKAVVIAEPDYMAEALPYYVSNPIYLIHEQRYGNIIHFTKSGKLATDLGEILQVSRELQRDAGVPVVIVLGHRLKNIEPDKVYAVGYNWRFSASADQIRDFVAATELLVQYGAASSDESYDVYLLRRDAPTANEFIKQGVKHGYQ